MKLKKTWKAFYYVCNLTEMVTRTFYSKYFAIAYGYLTNKLTGYKVVVKKI